MDKRHLRYPPATEPHPTVTVSQETRNVFTQEEEVREQSARSPVIGHRAWEGAGFLCPWDSRWPVLSLFWLHVFDLFGGPRSQMSCLWILTQVFNLSTFSSENLPWTKPWDPTAGCVLLLPEYVPRPLAQSSGAGGRGRGRTFCIPFVSWECRIPISSCLSNIFWWLSGQQLRVDVSKPYP